MNETREEAIKLEKGKANKLIKKSKKGKEKGKPVLIKSVGKEKIKGRLSSSSQGRSEKGRQIFRGKSKSLGDSSVLVCGDSLYFISVCTFSS